MSKIDQDTLREGIAPLDTDTRRAQYLSGQFVRADRVKDLDARYRWDLLWEIDAQTRSRVVAGLNDTHIDTALRRCVPPLQGATYLDH